MGPKIKNRQYLLSFVFNEPEPFLENELKQTLSENGYDILKNVDFEQGPISFKQMNVANKSNCNLIYNAERGNLFVAGVVRENVNKLFPELKQILIDKLDVDMDDMIKSFELISDNQVNSGKKPRDIINKYYKNCNSKKFDDIFEDKTSNYMIRVVTKHKDPRSANWFDLLIEPVSVRAYILKIVYRNRDFEKVINFASNIEGKIMDIIKLVEDGNVRS